MDVRGKEGQEKNKNNLQNDREKREARNHEVLRNKKNQHLIRIEFRLKSEISNSGSIKIYSLLDVRPILGVGPRGTIRATIINYFTHIRYHATPR